MNYLARSSAKLAFLSLLFSGMIISLPAAPTALSQEKDSVTETLAEKADSQGTSSSQANENRADDHMMQMTKATPQQSRFFENEIRPLLVRKCYSCHGPGDEPESNLRVDSIAGLLNGGDMGPAVVPGDIKKSLLIDAINYGDLEMPPDGKLEQTEIDALTRWVKSGAPWPGVDKVRVRKDGTFAINEKDRQHWSFIPVKRPDVPQTKFKSTSNNPVDAFVHARLETNSLEPAPEASRYVLIRRAYFDLIGLPPTHEEVQAFIADKSPDAYEKMIDHLLDSPHYGERWARHWLDLVRYAESNGPERDDHKPYAWRYRDYVVRALNEDKPYNEFVREQLAGDELDNPTRDSIIATGYYRLNSWDNNANDERLADYNELDDILRTTSEGFMGLTVGCARCHDHKFDPIPQADYYRMLSFIHNVKRYAQYANSSNLADPKYIFTPIGSKEEVDAWNKKLDVISPELKQKEEELSAIVEPAREKVLAENLANRTEEEQRCYRLPKSKRTLKEHRIALDVAREIVPKQDQILKSLEDSTRKRHDELAKRLKELRKQMASSPLKNALSVREWSAEPKPTYIFNNGNHRDRGEKVEPRFLDIFGGQLPEKPVPSPADPAEGLKKIILQTNGQTPGLRRRLADWIAGDDHPLTARVMVNRVWQHHFGRGLVDTPNDFGRAGSPPSHPLLIDYLASEFIANGWSIKHLHRLIMTSDTYKRTSSPAAKISQLASQNDPSNLLLWRQNLKRLEAEIIRDSVLAVSGTLNPKIGGPSFFPDLPSSVLRLRRGDWDKSEASEQRRRSIYMFVKRTLSDPMMAAFDYSNLITPVGKRSVSTVAPQALIMLNSEFVAQQAESFTKRIYQHGGDQSDAKFVEALFRYGLQRAPTTEESKVAIHFLEMQTAEFLKAETASLVAAKEKGQDPELSKEERDAASERAHRKAADSLCMLMYSLNEFVYID